MKNLIIPLAIFLSTALEAQQVYDFELENTQGVFISYSDISGAELTVIDFWATWCKPCVNSIPKLVKLSESYSADQIAFIGISIDSPRNQAKVKPFVQSAGVSYPVLLDVNQVVMQDFNISVIPTLLIVNASGEVVYTHEGFAPGDELEIAEAIEKYRHESK